MLRLASRFFLPADVSEIAANRVRHGLCTTGARERSFVRREDVR